MNTFIEAIEEELDHVGGRYIMGPAGIGCSIDEFRSVYSDYFDELVTDVERQERMSIITIDEGIKFKVF